MASWLNRPRTPPSVVSLLSKPSTMMLLARADCPVKDRPDVPAIPVDATRSCTTPGVMREKLMKLRPLMGRLWIWLWPTV